MKKTTLVIIGLSICVLVLATALGIVLTQKKADTTASIDQDFYNSIHNIFSEYEKVETIIDFKAKIAPMGIKRVDSDVVVLYCYRPPESGILEVNISQDLSPKIKKFFDRYRRTKSIQKLICSVRIPYEDKYGNKDWMPVLSFEFDKDTYKTINWKKFKAMELFKYAQNIQWHDMTT